MNRRTDRQGESYIPLFAGGIYPPQLCLRGGGGGGGGKITHLARLVVLVALCHSRQYFIQRSDGTQMCRWPEEED